MGLLDFIFGKKNTKEKKEESVAASTLLDFKEGVVYNDHKKNKNREHIDVSFSFHAIGNYCFWGYKMSSIKLHRIHTIGDWAFRDCKNLKKIDVDSVSTLGDQAFAYSSIEKISLFRLWDVGERVFEGCSELKEASLSLSKNLETTGRGMFYNCINLESVSLPNELKAIEESTFENCKKLQNIILPQNLKSIGKKAFANSGVRKIYIRSEIEHIEENAFTGCSNLEILRIPDNYKENIVLDLLSSRHLKEVVCPPNVQIKTR